MAMNIETLAIEDQQPLRIENTEACALDLATDITPLPPESFKLIGGGEGIVVF
jgi:hypothetical protein